MGPNEQLAVGATAHLHDPVESALAEVRERVVALERRLETHGATLDGHQDWLAGLQRWVSAEAPIAIQSGATPPPLIGPGTVGAVDPGRRLQAWMEIQTVMSWVAQIPLPDPGPLVSINVASCDRPAMVEAAVRSVLDQSYRHIEVIVVDDSDGPETAERMGHVADRRLRYVRTGARHGAGAAFNLGLSESRGEFVVFLDDDNLMHPEWVRTVVWAFAQDESAGALYGARLIEGAGGTHPLPTFEFTRYSRGHHERANFIDRNVLALRTPVHLRFDESLLQGIDWDFTLRLLADRSPLAVPAIACCYRPQHTPRVSGRAHRDSMARIRSAAHRGRPLSVVVHGSGEGLVEAVRELALSGVRVVSTGCPQLPAALARLRRPDLAAAIDELQPDLVLTDRSVTAAAAATAALHGVPLARTDGPVPDDVHWLGPVDRADGLEPGLRAALSAWLYARV